MPVMRNSGCHGLSVDIMRLAIVLVAVTSIIANQALAQVIGVEVRDGNVFAQQEQGWGRLTRDGRSTEVARSRDGRLIAYVHKEGGGEGDQAMNSISLCVVAEKTCRVIVSPKLVDSPAEENMTGANSPAFSYQAGVGPSGAIAGSLYFMTSAFMNMGAIHRVALGDGKISYVAPALNFTIAQNGKFAGTLNITSFTHGECQSVILDPNTKKVLQTKPLPC